MTTHVLPDLELIKKFYSIFLKDYDFILRQYEGHKNWIKFAPKIHELCVKYNCENYPELYEDENRIQATLLRAMFESDELADQFIDKLLLKTDNEKVSMINTLIFQLVEQGKAIDKNPIDKNSLKIITLYLFDSEQVKAELHK